MDRDFDIYPLSGEHRRKIQRIEAGDRILFYVNGTKKFPATGHVSRPYQDVTEDVWNDQDIMGWRYEIGIKTEILLDPEDYIDAYQIAPRLEYVKRWAPEDWPMAFQGNLHLLPKTDFYLLEDEMRKIKP
ncbi:MAG: hypothetical protein CL884_04505 [Dehalococcoidia bacterium]|nr:hypothetical protein [Dehalococcoidia bacterium]MBN41364.1 hypothetical protein [Chloroflexota bacterium]MQG08552.1 hypothetical protein [SAR202 cluster bacterium]MCH2528429.1 hypothetical protein [Dehalococcoidia bacterium]MQG26285.1 hypothetical protein [SAR202 cluster bacterium]|tara:strand:+ start:361 stop:750 length:390 start_codon:yes stop_codon:yes gene_type:complete